MRRFLAFYSGVLDTAGIHRLLGEVVAGAAGRGPVHLLLSSAGTIGFGWDEEQCVWAWTSPSLSACFPLSVLQERRL